MPRSGIGLNELLGRATPLVWPIDVEAQRKTEPAAPALELGGDLNADVLLLLEQANEKTGRTTISFEISEELRVLL